MRTVHKTQKKKKKKTGVRSNVCKCPLDMQMILRKPS